MVEQLDAFADQAHRGFVKTALQGDAAVFGHGAAGDNPKVVFEVLRGRAQALHVVGKALPGTCSRWPSGGAGGRCPAMAARRH